MFGLKKLKYPNLKIYLLHALIYFVYQIFFLFKHKLFHQLEMCTFLILPFVVLFFFPFEVHCVKRVELLLRRREALLSLSSMTLYREQGRPL